MNETRYRLPRGYTMRFGEKQKMLTKPLLAGQIHSL